VVARGGPPHGPATGWFIGYRFRRFPKSFPSRCGRRSITAVDPSLQVVFSGWIGLIRKLAEAICLMSAIAAWSQATCRSALS
jgi:hypothetical protein